MTRDLTCQTVREALSSRLDGEALPAGVDAAAVDHHAAACAGCGAWLAGAQRLHRVARVRPAEDVPDLTDSVLGALAGEGLLGPRPDGADARAHRGRVLQVLLLALVALQVLGALVALATGLADDGHASSDLAAFELAVGVTLGWAALHPRAARAVSVLAVPLGASLLLTAAVGLARGVTAPHLEAPHLLTVAAAVLAVVFAHHVAPSAPPSERRTLAA